MHTPFRNTRLALATTLTIMLIACGGKESDSTAAGSDDSATLDASAVGDNRYWSAERLKAAMDEDKGEKHPFVCTVLANSHYDVSGVAEAVPSLGIEKRADADMALNATSVDAAKAILNKGWQGTGDRMASLDIRRCFREFGSSDVKFAERPEGDYQELGGDRSIYLYYAISGETPPYEKLAERWRGYSNIQDAFAKRDRLAEIRSEINAGIEAVRTNPFVWIEFESKIPTFDFDKGVYPMEDILGPRTYITPNDGDGRRGYRVQFIQRDTFAAFKPESDQQARDVEAGVSEGMRQHLVRVYGKVEATEEREGSPTLLLTPTRVTVEQPQRWDIKNPRKLFEIVAR